METPTPQKDFPWERLRKELRSGSPTSIIDLVNRVIQLAYVLDASDIHLDPTENTIQVRMRIDGILQDEPSLPKLLQAEIISRIKILSDLRTDEHQVPQDGRFQLTIDGQTFAVRVSIIPTYYGENAVLRLLKSSGKELSLAGLGFSLSDREKIMTAVERPHGMILVTGSTGSGKTTTLYALMRSLNAQKNSILTIEDPIEYSLEGISQIGVNPKAGLTFANGLRSMLRQDPNSIMVGEIRDRETASLATNAALTGHLIFSTLHTKDAVSTIPRLVDLGIEPYLISATVNLVIAQRLVRRICLACKERVQVAPEHVRGLGAAIPETGEFFRGKGCTQCDSTGYRGRVSISEVLCISPFLASAIHEMMPIEKFRQEARKEGMMSLTEDGLQKAASGITTLEEVFRVFHE